MSSQASTIPVLTAHGVSKTYSCGTWPHRHTFRALDFVNLDLFAGRTLALVGDSGAGKTTLALCLAGIEQADTGEICIEGRSDSVLPEKKTHHSRRQVQLIWQHASAAMSPYLTAEEIVEEPMQILGSVSRNERSARVKDLFRMVDLRDEWTGRRLHQLSGGQRQRLGIARALAADPRVLILDEPFSGLDLSVRNQILNLLLNLQEARGLAYLYVSHDLGVVRYFADEVAVMQAGRIVLRLRPDELSQPAAFESMCASQVARPHRCDQQNPCGSEL